MKEKLKNLEKAINDKEYINLIQDIYNNEIVKQMKEYRQHCDISTFEHCLNVSYLSYKICKKLNWDYKSMARAAMLHDMFLYDWRTSPKVEKLTDYHAFVHPQIALENAIKLYNLNEIEKDIIAKHMWPVALHFPKYKETWVIIVTDKICAVQETKQFYLKKLQAQKIYKYAYIFLCIFFLKLKV